MTVWLILYLCARYSDISPSGNGCPPIAGNTVLRNQDHSRDPEYMWCPSDVWNEFELPSRRYFVLLASTGNAIPIVLASPSQNKFSFQNKWLIRIQEKDLPGVSGRQLNDERDEVIHVVKWRVTIFFQNKSTDDRGWWVLRVNSFANDLNGCEAFSKESKDSLTIAYNGMSFLDKPDCLICRYTHIWLFHPSNCRNIGVRLGTRLCSIRTRIRCHA